MNTSELDTAIVHEDSAIVVLNKPAGWVVNRSETYKEQTVQDWFEERLGVSPTSKAVRSVGEDATPEEIFASRGGVAHRLDKETSGLLLLAKTPEALRELMRQFKAREVKKTYVALVHGKVVPETGSIRLPMDRSDEDYKKFAVKPEGRMSETEYEVLEYLPGLPKPIAPRKGKSYQGFTLVRLTPKTGRTHQIRVHMSAIKHPLVSDATYAGRKRLVVDLEWCPRQFLHASTLCFTHPTTNEPLCFEAPLARDLQAALRLFADNSISSEELDAIEEARAQNGKLYTTTQVEQVLK